MVKCEICKNKIDTIFLNKLLGTYIKDEKGKKHSVCFSCQKKFNTKDDMLSKIK